MMARSESDRTKDEEAERALFSPSERVAIFNFGSYVNEVNPGDPNTVELHWVIHSHSRVIMIL